MKFREVITYKNYFDDFFLFKKGKFKTRLLRFWI
jgi:hypothetical protein